MVFRLDEEEIIFPNPELADENGLLAVGGDLKTQRLLLAYKHAIFPWYSDGDPICWYSTDPRCVIKPTSIKISKSMRKLINRKTFDYTVDQDFNSIIQACAYSPRADQDGTWINKDIIAAYLLLHTLGYAHSIEVWNHGNLVGGLYGILIGDVFVGESMFSKESNASKAGLIFLAQQFDLTLIDCQVPNDHLMSMGAQLISREDYLEILKIQRYQPNGLQKKLRYTP